MEIELQNCSSGEIERVTKICLKLLEISQGTGREKIISSVDYLSDLLARPPDTYPGYWSKAGIVELSSPVKKEIAIVHRMLHDARENVKSRPDDSEKREKKG